MDTADYFQDMYCSHSNYEVLGRAVSERQGVIHDRLAASAEVAEMSSDDDSSDGSGREFDIWDFINDILDDENVSGIARTKRGVELILYYMRNADAWRRDSLYRSIKKISNKKVKHMSLQKALKYTICRKKIEILRMVKLLGRVDDDDKSESDNDDVSESDNDGYENLKKLAPTVADRESEMSESNDESNDESENNDVDKEKVSEPCNPWIEYYVNQALANPSHNFKAL